jgi:hypothetical protein
MSLLSIRRAVPAQTSESQTAYAVGFHPFTYRPCGAYISIPPAGASNALPIIGRVLTASGRPWSELASGQLVVAGKRALV